MNTWANPVPFLAGCVFLVATFVFVIDVLVALVWPVTDPVSDD